MSDVKPEGAGGREAVEALIAEARETGPFEHYEPVEDVHWWRNLANRLADALEAAQQAPAVDRDALKRVIGEGMDRYWTSDYAQSPPDEENFGEEQVVVDQILASGILQDAAVVRAEALEEAALVMGNAGPTGRWLLDRAQAIREGRA
ncbi:MAG: hypothetical protein ACJLS2_02425 [Microcella pacifica]